MDQRIRDVRLVTERYAELKGLHVAYAGALWVCFGVALSMEREITTLGLLVPFAITVAAYLPVKWWLDRYYRTRFGQVVVSPLRQTKWLVPSLIAIAAANILFGGGPLGYGFLVVAISSLRIAIRDWPARGHYLVGCAAGAVAASIQFVPHSGMFGKEEAFGIAIIGLSYILLGLLDHRLLTSVLGGRQHPETIRSADSR